MSEPWVTICNENDLIANTGVCALHNGEQVAIFLDGMEKQVFAVSNYDPIGRANVLSRGLLGDVDGLLVVASPLYKQHFCLATGTCLEEPAQTLKTYDVRLHAGKVQLKA